MTVLQKLGAYSRLLRLSNGPTAIADVWMGYAVVSGTLEPTWPLALATAASLCLYHGGMALNDVRDAEQDKIDNRGRPIAAGQVSLQVATWIARGLLLVGILVGVLGAALAGSFPGMNIALMLAVAVVAYNSRYKSTLAGPFLMAACRFLNVLVGVSSSGGGAPLVEGKTPPAIGDAHAAALVVGCYVLGLTLFARHETTGRNRRPLILALLVSAFAFVIAGTTLWVPPTTSPAAWALMLIVAGMFSLRGMVAGILQPTPKNIGRGVGIAIQGLVVIDATLATLYAGPVAGLAILTLLPVTMLLARWIPQT